VCACARAHTSEIIGESIRFNVMCRRYTIYTTVVILQLVKLRYMFRPLAGHHQANKEIALFLCWPDDGRLTAETCSEA